MNTEILDINIAFRVSQKDKAILKNIVDEHDISLSLLIRVLCKLLAEEKITITKELLEAEKYISDVRYATKKPLRSPGRPRKNQRSAA